MSELLPVLSPHAQATIRVGYGLLMLCTIAWTAYPGRWFFRSERWGGYGDSSWSTEVLQNPFSHVLITGLWAASAGALVMGVDTVLFAAINLAICWYYFIFMRWRSLLRGMGAPGFFCYWLGLAVLILEVGRHLDPSGRILAVGVLALQVDFALIQLCAGSYKSVCGYARNTGMQLGMANPFWGHHWRLFKAVSPANPVFGFLNQSAFRVQILAGLLMLYPPTRPWGALAIGLSFLFVMTQIRLGFLLPKIMLSGLLFLPAGTAVDRWLAQWAPSPETSQRLAPLSGEVAAVIAALLVVYMALLPLAKFSQWYNYLEGRRLWAPLQRFLEGWCNLFGIIIWRVFSVDVIDFFVRVYQVDADGYEEEYTSLGKANFRTRGRYIQVAESIALTSIFTALKYHPADFRDKLVRYARTVPCPEGGSLRFARYAIDTRNKRFEFVHQADFFVEPGSGEVRHQEHVPSPVLVDSPVRAAHRPGSYLPVGDAITS